jgi:isopentenyldiphosphate isomerase
VTADDERVDWIDPEDRILGQVTRREMRRRNLWHRTVAIWVQNAAGEVYVHRRSHGKDLFPGLLDLFVGGVVAAGESYRGAATRELAEELGVTGAPLRPLFATAFESAETQSHIAVFAVVAEGPFVLQAEEVLWGDFVPVAELERLLRLEAFVPDGIAVYRELARRHPELLAERESSPPRPESEDDLPAESLPEAQGYRCQVCGGENAVAVDLSGGEAQELIEDCTHCCAPNRLLVTLDPERGVEVEVREP